jgi:cobalt/nickel transport system permease protein
MLLLHIGGVHLDVDSQKETRWHDLTPQTRILCVLLMVLAIALTPNGRWWTWAIYGIGILGVLLASRVTFSVLLKRFAVELSFVGVILLGTLFRDGGEVLWQWGWLRITTAGLTVLGSVTLKAGLSLLLLNLLVLTTPIPVLLQALGALRVPPLLVAILASMYRYIGVLIEEFNSMQRAAVARNLMSNRRWHRLVIGNAIGSLFIRTYERGERVHYAMLSRGYDGLPSIREMPKNRRRDMLALTLTVIFALLGQAVYL